MHMTMYTYIVFCFLIDSESLPKVHSMNEFGRRKSLIDVSAYTTL